MRTFGRAHPTLQQYDSSTLDFETLLKDLPNDENPILNHRADDLDVKSSDISTWFPKDDHPVFHSFQPERAGYVSSLLYEDLHKCVASCPPYKSQGNVVVAVLLPTTMMAETAVVLVSLLSKSNVCVAPLDPNRPPAKIVEAIEQLKCKAIVTTKDLFEKIWVKIKDHGFDDVRVVGSTGQKVGAIQWNVIHQSRSKGNGKAEKDVKSKRPVMLLRTSGTTSVPKVVPLTASALLYNATCIATSLKLQRGDVGCNAMPLFHIGGVACALLAVLVSGSSVVMMGQFDPERFLDCLASKKPTSTPTWYYGVPSMHKVLTLTAQARLQNMSEDFFPTNLRFIRSGAAPLPHESALDLSKVFRTQVIPTYSMSEAMPICSSHKNPVVWNESTEEALKNSVGPPIGNSLKIVNELGNTLPYGTPGEVALFGPGVMKKYAGVSRSKTHTADGWLRTGDVGELDRQGNLKLKGRVKEMIKRGGDQVWPNEVDRVVEKVPGVSTAVTFGVPNELWGEEVAVAVVLDDEATSIDRQTMERDILKECRQELDNAAVPSQVKFVEGRDSLLKGPTGKYLRAQLANHLDVQPVDTGALRILEGRAHVHQVEEDESSQHKSLAPSPALNGVRLITAYYVVQTHVGLYPNNEWLRIQSSTFDMPIFFMLGAFQLACSTKASVLKNWAHWVGTKIGTMHALFVVTQLIGLGSYLLFHCGETGYQTVFEDSTCQDHLKLFLPVFAVHTATGMVPREDAVNPPAWFQSAFYMFLMLFSLLDARLRNLTARGLSWRLALNLVIASVFFIFFPGTLLNYLVIGWLPTLVSAMIAGYFFSRYAVDNSSEANSWFQRPVVQGIITDAISILFILFEVAVAMSPDCIYVTEEDFLEMRPGEPLPDDSFVNEWGDGLTYVFACDVQYDEFIEYTHSKPDNIYNGRWPTTIGDILGWCRVATPLLLLWLYALAHGRGLTARVLKNKVLQWLAPLAYPLYLLHIPIARYYWVATRGFQAEHWWYKAASFPVPVEWYETFIIVGICLLVGYILDRSIVPFLTRYTVSLGVKISQFVPPCFGSTCRNTNDQTHPITTANTSSSSLSNMDRVEEMVKRITGNQQVARSTNLSNLGLDSLGATALLGTLRVSVPAARKLSLQDLATFETVGDLVDALDAFEEDKESSQKETVTVEEP